MKTISCKRACIAILRNALAKAEVPYVHAMQLNRQTFANISNSCNSCAHASNSQALLKILRDLCDRLRFNVNLLASCTVASLLSCNN